MEEPVVDGWSVLEQAHRLAGRGERVALATVVWRQAPSSGHQGARAIVTGSGEIHGWIGGACAEPTVVREARQAIADGRSRLLFLGETDEAPPQVEGMVHVPMACQSEGALQIFIEPMLPTLHLVVVGRSPMARTLTGLADVLGWHAELVEAAALAAAGVDARSVVVVATQGHGDEEALQQAIAAGPAYLGLVASRKRGEAVLGYLADRGVPRAELERVHTPVGLDLGHTTHAEIAVSVLAELVRLRAAGELGPAAPAGRDPGTEAAPEADPGTALDPVCQMTVAREPGNHPFTHDGETYYFCCPGCRARFEEDPGRFLTAAGAEGEG